MRKGLLTWLTICWLSLHCQLADIYRFYFFQTSDLVYDIRRWREKNILS